MAYIRKLKSGKWQCLIRRKGYPYIAKSFLEKSVPPPNNDILKGVLQTSIFDYYS